LQYDHKVGLEVMIYEYTPFAANEQGYCYQDRDRKEKVTVLVENHYMIRNSKLKTGGPC
jgi:hypothetical protein